LIVTSAPTSAGQAAFFTPKILAGLGVAGLIAWLIPFDQGVETLTGGQPAPRCALLLAAALAGLFLTRRVGLHVEPQNLKRPVLTPVAVGLAVAIGCTLADRLLSGGASEGYVRDMAHAPLVTRWLYYIMRAFDENILYRLFLASGLAWLFSRLRGTAEPRPTTGAFAAAFVVAQLVNIWINASSLHALTPIALVHDAVRYVAPALVWSWLFWKHGFQSNEIACTTVHVWLQPLAGLP